MTAATVAVVGKKRSRARSIPCLLFTTVLMKRSGGVAGDAKRVCGSLKLGAFQPVVESLGYS